ncbi:unnamed protein product [Closterium sp. Yama58-4]|nr:unnamed protein product [Closterium sp. Yama58-4]
MCILVFSLICTLYSTIDAIPTVLLPALAPPLCSDLSHNYLTGRALKPLAPLGCALVRQRQEAACNAFCGVSSAAGGAAACGGHGVCYPQGPSLAPACLCDAGFVRSGDIGCLAQGQNRNFSNSQPILPPASVLTRGTQRETRGDFTTAPVTLFVFEAGQGLSGCGLQLAFHANFTFSLSPQSGRVGFNGFAFVVSATDRVGRGTGVGYGEMDKRSVAVEFDSRQDKQHGDMSSQHVGLNIRGEDKSLAAVPSPFPLSSKKAYTAWVDYEPGDPGTIQVFLADSKEKPQEAVLERRLALCEVLQGGVDQHAFFFGFVASTTVKPFQKHVILESTVDTGLPSPPRPVTITPSYGLQLLTNTYMPEWASPFPRYVSADYRVAPGKQDSWVISDFHSWDSVPFLGWPVKDQKDCNACWAFALVASVEAAYGIATNREAPQLSVESLFAAMGLTSEADKCSTGGSPTEALETLLILPNGGITKAGAPNKKYPVHAFERTRFKGFVGLMLAVRRQPVVVHIEASAREFAQYDGTFKYQDPGCYTGRLNHAVLVVGYFVLRNDGSQNRIAPPFWIIRNSWGVEWGDRGHMRMDIQGGDGMCGINVLPGIYPIVKSSHLFKLLMDMASKHVLIWTSELKNPCYVGTCINDGKGSYSCICPPNYVESTTIDNFPTCDPANTTASTLAVSGSNWWCSDVLPLVGLSLAQFTQNNPAIDCSRPLPRNVVLQLGNSLLIPCTAFFYTISSDTCWSISTQLGLTSSNLTALNPGLDCFEPIKAGRSLCVERNATFAFTVPQCSRYGVLTPQDTCERLLRQVAGSEGDPTGAGEVNAMRWAELCRNNPGLICSDVIPITASAVGSNTVVQICLRAEYWSFDVGRCKKGSAFPAMNPLDKPLVAVKEHFVKVRLYLPSGVKPSIGVRS